MYIELSLFIVEILIISENIDGSEIANSYFEMDFMIQNIWNWREVPYIFYVESPNPHWC